MTTFTVTHEDGSQSTVSSKRVYAFAVEAFFTAWNETSPSWHVIRWSQTFEAAAKARDGFRRDGLRPGTSVPEWRNARVVPVN